MATEVWVKPAALIIIPSDVFLASCIMVTISPTIFDCTNSQFIFNSFALVKQLFFNCLKVIDPYCDCSLSPNRLRLGPLIRRILLLI